MPKYFVRLGTLAEMYVGVADFSASRGRRVIVRTQRGVELGEIVGPSTDSEHSLSAGQVSIVRPTTESDELLIRRLGRHKREAVEACRDELAKSGSTATLLDVDQLFDGGTLIMHFLGPVDPIAKRITNEIVARYESIVRTRHFAKLLKEGCGPDCGTAQGGGCGTGGCATCSTKCH